MRNLEDEDLGAIDTSDPGDGIGVTDGDNLAAEKLAGDVAAVDEAVGGGARAGTGLERGAAVIDNVEGADKLVAQVAVGPGLGRLGGRGNRGEGLSLLAPAGVAAGRVQVEDQLALVAGVAGGHAEGHQRGDVGTAVVGRARDEAAPHVEVNGARVGVVQRGGVREDGGDGRGAGSIASIERSGVGESGGADKGSGDGDEGLSVHICFLLEERLEREGCMDMLGLE